MDRISSAAGPGRILPVEHGASPLLPSSVPPNLSAQPPSTIRLVLARPPAPSAAPRPAGSRPAPAPCALHSNPPGSAPCSSLVSVQHAHPPHHAPDDSDEPDDDLADSQMNIVTDYVREIMESASRLFVHTDLMRRHQRLPPDSSITFDTHRAFGCDRRTAEAFRASDNLRISIRRGPPSSFPDSPDF